MILFWVFSWLGFVGGQETGEVMGTKRKCCDLVMTGGEEESGRGREGGKGGEMGGGGMQGGREGGGKGRERDGK